MFWFRDENSKIEYRWDFQCRACSFKSSKKSEVLKHVESKHGIVHKKNPTSYKEIFDKISGNFQKCPSCLQYFNTEELMKKHIESSHTVIDRCFTLCSIFPKHNTKLPMGLVKIKFTAISIIDFYLQNARQGICQMPYSEGRS